MLSCSARKRKEVCERTLPAEGDLDGCGEAGSEQVSREVRVHGQQLAGLAGCQLDAVLHGGRQRHLSEWMAGVNGCHLDGHKRDRSSVTAALLLKIYHYNLNLSSGQTAQATC